MYAVQASHGDVVAASHWQRGTGRHSCHIPTLTWFRVFRTVFVSREGALKVCYHVVIAADDWSLQQVR